MALIPYVTMIRSKNHTFDYRLRLVLHAAEHGIKATAGAFSCSRNTVRLWLRRYQAHRRSGLVEQSRAPKSCPHKTPKAVERQVIAARKRSGFGGERLVHEFGLACSASAAKRILRQGGLTRRRRKRSEKRNDLRAVKARYKPFTRFQMDTMFLWDIPFYRPQMRRLKLPHFQYTIREVPTGALFVAYADELSAYNAHLVVTRFLTHLERTGIDTRRVIIQTDNGSEFTSTDGVTTTIEGHFRAKHRFIPPGCSNANADVESVHNTIQAELFRRQRFVNRRHFLLAVDTYQHYYNLYRKIGTKAYRSPLAVLEDADPRLNKNVLLLPAIDLDIMLAQTPPTAPQGGQYVPDQTGWSRVSNTVIDTRPPAGYSYGKGAAVCDAPSSHYPVCCHRVKEQLQERVQQ